MSSNSILILAGEASGDYHAAALVRELKQAHPDLRFSGIGGDRLAEAGMELLHHYRDINTIGLSEGLAKIRNIVSAYTSMKRELRSGRHAVFMPVDYPDVNLRLCLLAKRAGVKVCYFISPQIWAWRRGRMRKIRQRVDRMMTIFPFEETLYREAGVKADFVGHTMARETPDSFDKAALAAELGIERTGPVIALVPGSRQAEIQRMLPVMAQAAKIFSETRPDAQYVLPLAGRHLAEAVNTILAGYPVSVRVISADAARVMAAADCGLVTSGTATLQAALVGMPHALVYILDRLTWWVALNVLKPLLMDKDIHVGIANVLSIHAEKQGAGPIRELLDAGVTVPCHECGRPLLVPEQLQDNANPEALAEWLERFTTDAGLTQAMKRGFDRVRAMLAAPEESQKAARIVGELLHGDGKK